MPDADIKKQVRQFYDQVGWQTVSEGLYQNARYEDLRPVSRDYIHRCHLRVNRHLRPNGRYLLDAGSGPVQYPEYVTYSAGYKYRVCLDISILALQEARKRLNEHALVVAADVANLPFKPEAFDGAVSLHTLHHLPLGEQKKAYSELRRVLAKGSAAVIVNGWTDSKLMRRWQWLVRLMERLGKWFERRKALTADEAATDGVVQVKPVKEKPTGTFVEKLDSGWLRRELPDLSLQIFVWRSVSVRFLRAVIHTALAGKLWLRLLYRLEERYPVYFGENGQYPLIVLHKPDSDVQAQAGSGGD